MYINRKNNKIKNCRKTQNTRHNSREGKNQYKSAFDLIAKSIKDDEGKTIEVWYARELQQVLGYARWEKFVVAIGPTMES